jgi:hypothetical protein
LDLKLPSAKLIYMNLFKQTSINELFKISLFLFLPFGYVQAFDSGSNGSFGALNVTSPRTIPLPADGILHCTTVNISSSLSFTKNAANTPVYILATGDIIINGGGFSVDGQGPVGKRGGSGGPGGFDGGQGGSTPSNGFGPGGGKGGSEGGAERRGGGGFGTAGDSASTGGRIYGNSWLIPLIGGSGGGGSNSENRNGGGSGGGAILIASNTKVTFSSGTFVSASGGGYGLSGGGSGGSVRIVAPEISGLVYIYVPGGSGGGFGRIRIDALSNSLVLQNPDASTAQATFGSNMVVFPPNMPELRVTRVGETNIPLSQNTPVFILLPPGSSTTQTVQVQAKNFKGIVPLTAVITPEAGERKTYNFEIDSSEGGESSGNVEVQIPGGVSMRVDVWTR